MHKIQWTVLHISSNSSHSSSNNTPTILWWMNIATVFRTVARALALWCRSRSKMEDIQTHNNDGVPLFVKFRCTTSTNQFPMRGHSESSIHGADKAWIIRCIQQEHFFFIYFSFCHGNENTVCRRNDSLSSCHCMHVEISHTRHSRRTNASFDVKHMCWKSVVWSGQQRQQRWRRRQRRRKLEVFAHFFFHSALAWFAHLTFAGGHGAIAISLHIYIAIILCFIKDQI